VNGLKAPHVQHNSSLKLRCIKVKFYSSNYFDCSLLPSCSQLLTVCSPQDLFYTPPLPKIALLTYLSSTFYFQHCLTIIYFLLLRAAAWQSWLMGLSFILVIRGFISWRREKHISYSVYVTFELKSVGCSLLSIIR
jgi:hypothetical protein